MPQPSASASAPKTAASPAAPSGSHAAAPDSTATEKVTRPDEGLARGVWEAPSWAFWVLLGLVVIGATLYLLRRLGVLELKKKKAS